MKGDFSRNTFSQPKHFDRVLQQQGRVTLDADQNEQARIFAHRLESSARDIIGVSGAPMDNAGFGLVNAATLTAAERTAIGAAAAGDLAIGAGHYYVNGILVENDSRAAYTNQPHLKGLAPLTGAGTYVAYLDVWKRFVMVLDDNEIREPALGGPDTAGRSQVIWQVKTHKLSAADADATCDSVLSAFNAAIAPSSGTMAARAEPVDDPERVCVLPPEAGYRRLENQLYRVEIHDASNPLAISFKWSRENGSIVAQGSFINNQNDKVRLAQPGRDAVRGFAPTNWVELTSTSRELRFAPGILVRLLAVDGADLTLDLTTATAPIVVADFADGMIVRRWDSNGLVLLSSANPAVDNGFLRLEDGVQVKFTGTGFHNGDYWEIPARTVLNDIIWPRDAASQPRSLPPAGTLHNFVRLGVVTVAASGAITIQDCRDLFPPLTALTELTYVGGDGQEVMPDFAAPATLVLLPRRLEAGVSNGTVPVVGAKVRFTVTRGAGLLNGDRDTVFVETDPQGIARCTWSIDSANWSHEVVAVLVNSVGAPQHIPVRYHATHSVAAQVAYNPRDCSNLAGAFTVQAALDRLCRLDHGCCVTVGKDGRYPDLASALDDQLRRTLRICICLLPGEHAINGDLAVRPPEKGASIHIHGSGHASQVQVNGRGSIAFEGTEDRGFDQIRLEGFDLRFENGSLSFSFADDLELESLRVFGASEDVACACKRVGAISVVGCSFFNMLPGRVLAVNEAGSAEAWRSVFDGLYTGGLPSVTLNQTGVLTLAHNTISVANRKQGEVRPEVDPNTRLFTVDLSALRRSEIPAFADEFAKALPSSAAQRRAYSAALMAAVRQVDPISRQSYAALGTLIAAKRPSTQELIPIITGLRTAAAIKSPQTALSINDIGAQLTMNKNVVDGVTVLYGDRPARPTEDEIRESARQKKSLSSGWTERDANISENDFGTFTTGEEFWGGLFKRGEMPGAIRNMSITNNRFHYGRSLFVAYFPTVTGNWFQLIENIAGASVACRATFVSNLGPGPGGDNGLAAFFAVIAEWPQDVAYLDGANIMRFTIL